MTKKETAILRNMYDEAMDRYMEYVRSKESAPVEVIERACAISDVWKALSVNDDSVEGA